MNLAVCFPDPLFESITTMDTTEATKPKPANNPVVSLASSSTESTAVTHEQGDPQMLAGLSERFFCQLDIKPLIDDFFVVTREHIPWSSMEFNCSRLGVTMSTGQLARHSLEYDLVIAQQELGQIRLTRGRIFTNKEISLLEKLLTCLMYPLRNAAMYYQAIESAFSDPLTGISNRASMNQALPREIQLAHRRNEPLSLLAVDSDNFKQVNDNHGHAAGDNVLKTLTQIFQDCVRNTDLIFRFGGDEFIIALPDTTVAGSQDVAERIRHKVEACKFQIDNVTLFLSVSIGATEIIPTDTFDSALERADQALYKAKRNGRNQVFCL
ncbi:MAG TPA: GGDEF domain-containing protein [Gammaproteobacteria bacterium]|nr:GGDEF domain-containing protein [Gammaproteobacteria bacterium]